MNIENNNNFTLVRVLLASLVMLGHFKILGGNVTPAYLFSFADLAVEAFFVVSGFLVASSFDRLPKLTPFYIKRFFRIYPLYFSVVIVQAIAMLMFFAHDIRSVLASTLSYLGVNLIFANFLQHDIGGLLANSPNHGINPSLWTLKVEVAFYLIVPLIHKFFRRFGLSVLCLIFIISTAYFLYFVTRNAELAKQLPGQMRFFVVGMGFFYYRNSIKFSPKINFAIFSCCLTLLLFKSLHFPAVLHPLVVGSVVFFAAMRLPSLPFKSDISFGIYLIHGPVIQLLILSGYYVDSWLCLALVCLAVVVLASLADHFIERPGIRIGSTIARRFNSFSGASRPSGETF